MIKLKKKTTPLKKTTTKSAKPKLVIRVSRPKVDPLDTCDSFSPYTADDFRRDGDIYDFSPRKLSGIWQEVFKKEASPFPNLNGGNYFWCYQQVAYELSRQDSIRRNLPLSPTFKEQYRAVFAKDFERLTDFGKWLYGYLKTKKEDVPMAVKTKQVAALKKAQAVKQQNSLGIKTKMTTRQFWHKILTQNFSKKLTDKQLGDLCKAEFPDLKLKTFDKINDVRVNLYNKGLIGEIKEASVAYGEDRKPLAKKRGPKAEAKPVKAKSSKVAAPAVKKAVVKEASAPKAAAKALKSKNKKADPAAEAVEEI